MKHIREFKSFEMNDEIFDEETPKSDTKSRKYDVDSDYKSKLTKIKAKRAERRGEPVDTDQDWYDEVGKYINERLDNEGVEGVKYCKLLKDHDNTPRGSYGYLSGNKIVFPYSNTHEAACSKDYVDSHPDMFRILRESERSGKTLDEVREMLTRAWNNSR